MKSKHINLKQKWRVTAFAATGYGNLICDMTLAPSEIKSPLLQYPPGKYPHGDTTSDSKKNIEKEDQTSTDPSLVYS